MSRATSRMILVLSIMTLTLLFLFQGLAWNTGQRAAALNPNDNALPQSAQSGSGLERLIADTGGKVTVSTDSATGVPGFIRIEPGSLSLQVNENAAPEERAMAFFQQYGDAIGLQDAASELVYLGTENDLAGATHVSYQQMYHGVAVYAARINVHFNGQGQLTAVNGTFIPKITVNPTPNLTAEAAANIATDALAASNLTIRNNTLLVYRAGLAQGVVGPNHLVYEVEVTDGANLRELFYVDAHTGAVVERINLIQNALFRRIYDGGYGPGFIVWEEGDPIPYGDVDIDNIISGTGESYNLFFNAFGFDSYDGAGAEMEAVNDDPTINCPNANWNGVSTNYCTGVTGDDTVAHEWGHAYTQYTHNLIYQWQPGALNESYSDIWGDVVDLINGRGLDTPGGLRSDDTCSIYTPPRAVLTVNAPPNIAGDYVAQAAAFGPPLTAAGITGTVVLADDGTGVPGPAPDGTTDTTSNACDPLVNGAEITGTIALVDRGVCAFTVKVANAQAAGAIGVIVMNYNTSGLPGMGGSDPTITIPSLGIGYNDGLLIRDELPDVNATLHSSEGDADDSYRWLSGEDDPAFGGAIRDMWNPTCYGHPGKVSDVLYTCSTADGGGVHSNSGVPNHAFALLVDGGTYNGTTVTGIDLTKASHIYWQAQSAYQTPSSDFVDHADSLEASCTDLIGVNLPSLTDGTPSGEVISAADCTQVTNAMTAVEMRVEPIQCNFQPLLNPDAPPLCASPLTTVYSDTLEVDPTSTWTISHTDVYSATNYEWEWVSSLPDGRTGSAFFALDADGQCSLGTGDVSGATFAQSPEITIPAGITVTRLAFDHWMASEVGWDGGNVKISVNGGAWEVIAAEDYIFNPYNTVLQTAGAGNTNPLAGEPAFSGSDGGEVSGSWGQSQIYLSNYAAPGDTIQLRYDFGMDGCTGLVGWYVDNVHVYACSGDPAISVPDSVTATLPMTDTVTETLTINNTGTEFLNWDIFESAGATAVSSAPASPNHTDRAGDSGTGDDVAPAQILPTYSPDGGSDTLSEGFDDITTLPGSGWSQINNSDPLGSTGWFQGNSAVFPAQSGDPTSYIGANFNNTSGAGTISNWLLTPELNLEDGTTLTFYTRNPAGNPYPDRLEVRMSTSGSSTDVGTTATSVGDFTDLLLEINPNLEVGGYPEEWTQFSVTLSGVGTPTSGRLAFRYFVTDGGPTGNNSNYIGIDTVEYGAELGLCDVPTDIPWLAVSPTSGMTAPGEDSAVTLTFNSSGYATGVYTGTLCVTSDDPVTALVPVTVTMTVIDRVYDVALSDHMALTGTAGTAVTYTLSITNTGNGNDSFDIELTGNTWPAALSETSVDLGPGESTTVEVIVQIPDDAATGEMDTATVTVTSGGDDTVSDSAVLTTTAEAATTILYLPIIFKP